MNFRRFLLHFIGFFLLDLQLLVNLSIEYYLFLPQGNKRVATPNDEESTLEILSKSMLIEIIKIKTN